MEREVLETFEVAKKAADAAAGEADSPDADRCLDALRRLRAIRVNTDVLVSTQVGKRLRHLTKHPHSGIQEVATDLFGYWKKVVLEETGKKNGSSENGRSDSSGKIEKARPIKVEKTSVSASVKLSENERSDSSGKIEKARPIKVEKNSVLASVKLSDNERSDSSGKIEKARPIKAEKNSVSASVKLSDNERSDSSGKIEKARPIKVEKNSVSASVKLEKKAVKVERVASVPNGPPKLTSLVKCNDPTRDKIRELLVEAFAKVSEETSNDDREEVKNILDEVDACDPFRVAVTVESVLFERLGRSTGAHKAKYRSIMFNLRADNNTDFRRRVLTGQVRPERLPDITPEEMASDSRKQENNQIKAKALLECQREGAPKATTDQFKCGRCGQRKTTYYQLQTRSADEPMTTFVTCVNCNNHWKFC